MSKLSVAALALTAAAVASVAALSGKVADVEPGFLRAIDPTKIETPRSATHCAKGAEVTCDALETNGPPKKPKYRRVKIGSIDCAQYKLFSDGGVEVLRQWTETKSPRKGLEVVAGSCVGGADVVSAVADGGVDFVPQECACRKAKGECWVVLDGGAKLAPFGKTLGPGYPDNAVWSGDGCAPKACVELLGLSGWPTECPR
jgi:hypothetical protein